MVSGLVRVYTNFYCVTVMDGLTPTIEHYPVSVRLSEGSPVPGRSIHPLVRTAPCLHDGRALNDGTLVELRAAGFVT